MVCRQQLLELNLILSQTPSPLKTCPSFSISYSKNSGAHPRHTKTNADTGTEACNEKPLENIVTNSINRFHLCLHCLPHKRTATSSPHTKLKCSLSLSLAFVTEVRREKRVLSSESLLFVSCGVRKLPRGHKWGQRPY